MQELLARPALDVVIVNYRTPDLTISAIDYLKASSISSHELRIHVVDNGSRDDSVARIASSHPDVTLIGLPRNLGFAGGNNAALERIVVDDDASTDRDRRYVLLLNSDVEVTPAAIQTCLDFMDSNPAAGVVGPRVYLPDGSLDLACRRGFPTISNSFWKLTGMSKRYPGSRRFAGYNLTYLPEDRMAEVDAVGGSFMLIRLTAIDQVGLLDERFFMYGEDLDWAYRFKAAGWKVFYLPDAEVLHLKGATARRQSTRMIYEFYRAMWLFHAKHYAGQTYVVVNWLVMIGIVARGALALVVNGFRPVERKRFA